MADDLDANVVRLRVNTYRQIHHAPPLVYHSGQASIAQAEAERLLANGTYEPRDRTDGLNVLVFTPSESDVTEIVLKAVDAWYGKSGDYDFTKPGITDPNTEQFTRMVWKSTKRFGAGVAVSSSSSGPGSGKTAVVILKFDPPGNTREDLFSTNVLPAGVEHLVFDDFYTKEQSDDRFLSVTGLEDYRDYLEAAAVAAAEERVAEVETHLESNFYRDYEVDDGFLSFPLYQTFCNLVRDEYYVKGAVDARLSNVQRDAACNLAGFSNYIVSRADHLDDETERIEDRVDQVNADLQAQIDRFDQLSNVVEEDYYDKQEADGLFATITSLQSLSNMVVTEYYDKQEADGLFYTLDAFQGYSNFVDSEYYSKEVSDQRYTFIEQHQELSNTLAEDYYTRYTTDAKYAGSVNFAGLSNKLINDYITSNASVNLFANKKNFEDRVKFVDENFYDKTESDNLFARQSNLEALEDTVDDVNQDVVGLSNSFVDTRDAILFDTSGVTNDSSGLRLSTNARDGASNIRFIRDGNDPDASELMRIDDQGRIGIGTRTPLSEFHVIGEVYATQGFVQASDCNLKHDIRPIAGALDKVNEIGGYTFEMMNDTESGEKKDKHRRRHAGLIAQEVIRVLPEAVSEQWSHDTSGMTYGVSYGDVTALLVEAVKEMSVALKRQPFVFTVEVFEKTQTNPVISKHPLPAKAREWIELNCRDYDYHVLATATPCLSCSSTGPPCLIVNVMNNENDIYDSNNNIVISAFGTAPGWVSAQVTIMLSITSSRDGT